MSSAQPVSLSHKHAAPGWYMGLRNDVSEKTLSIIAMINILNRPTPSLLHPATHLLHGFIYQSALKLFRSSEWCMARCQPCVPMQTIYIHSNHESMSLRCIKLAWVKEVEGGRGTRVLIFLIVSTLLCNKRGNFPCVSVGNDDVKTHFVLSSYPNTSLLILNWLNVTIKCLSTLTPVHVHVTDVAQLPAQSGMCVELSQDGFPPGRHSNCLGGKRWNRYV